MDSRITICNATERHIKDDCLEGRTPIRVDNATKTNNSSGDGRISESKQRKITQTHFLPINNSNSEVETQSSIPSSREKRGIECLREQEDTPLSQDKVNKKCLLSTKSEGTHKTEPRKKIKTINTNEKSPTASIDAVYVLQKPCSVKKNQHQTPMITSSPPQQILAKNNLQDLRPKEMLPDSDNNKTQPSNLNSFQDKGTTIKSLEKNLDKDKYLIDLPQINPLDNTRKAIHTLDKNVDTNKLLKISSNQFQAKQLNISEKIGENPEKNSDTNILETKSTDRFKAKISGSENPDINRFKSENNFGNESSSSVSREIPHGNLSTNAEKLNIFSERTLDTNQLVRVSSGSSLTYQHEYVGGKINNTEKNVDKDQSVAFSLDSSGPNTERINIPSEKKLDMKTTSLSHDPSEINQSESAEIISKISLENLDKKESLFMPVDPVRTNLLENAKKADKRSGKNLLSNDSLNGYNTPGDAGTNSTELMGRRIEFIDFLEESNNFNSSLKFEVDRISYSKRKNLQFRRVTNKHFIAPSGKITNFEFSNTFERKRNGRSKRNNPERSAKKKSRVEVLEYPRTYLGVAIIELPANAIPGDKVVVSWPIGRDENGNPHKFLIEVPETVSSFKGGRQKRLLKVLAPDCFEREKKVRNLSTQKDGISSPVKSAHTEGTPSFRSPQKERWRNYSKTSSRIGKNYQVPALPSSTVFRDQDENMNHEEDEEEFFSSREEEYFLRVPSGPLGIVLADDSHFPGILISRVKSSSSFVEKVSPGDHIIAVDEIDVSSMSLTEACKIILDRKNRERRFKITKYIETKIGRYDIQSNATISEQKRGVIWDCDLAEKAKLQGENIDNFLGRPFNSAQKVMRMQVLHESNYSVKDAESKYREIAINPDWVAFNRDEADGFAKAMTERKKDFSHARKQLNRSVTSCLIYYYSTFKSSPAYNILKETFQVSTDEDWCAICDDGGDLICCDSCMLWYHPTCLSPPLKELPEGDWFCPSCVKKSEKNAAEDTEYIIGRPARTTSKNSAGKSVNGVSKKEKSSFSVSLPDDTKRLVSAEDLKNYGLDRRNNDLLRSATPSKGAREGLNFSNRKLTRGDSRNIHLATKNSTQTGLSVAHPTFLTKTPEKQGTSSIGAGKARNLERNGLIDGSRGNPIILK